jgi:hypothetical protein
VSAGHRRGYERVEVSLNERVDRGRRSGRGVRDGGTDVAQDRRVDAVVEARRTAVGDGSNPVVRNRSISVENE